MTQYLLLVYVLMGPSTEVFSVSGTFPLARCNELASVMAQQASRQFPSASGITYQCLPMAKA